VAAEKEKQPPSVEEKIARAVSHPMRVRIIKALEKLGEGSPKILSERFEEPLNLVAYHVRVLEEKDCIEFVRTEPRRGAQEHFYRLTGLKLFGDRDHLRIKAHASRQVIRNQLWLDEKGTDEVSSLCERIAADFALIQRNVDERIPPPQPSGGLLESLEVIRQLLPKNERPLPDNS
jgi:DNA-binding transcriptional ArsR family regulator